MSAVKTGGSGGGKKRKSDDTFRAKVPTQAQLDACKVKIKAYSDEEYSKLDWISRFKLRKVRQEQKDSQRGGQARAAHSTVSSVTIPEGTGDGGGRDQSSTASTRGTSGSNSSNPALVRPNVADRT